MTIEDQRDVVALMLSTAGFGFVRGATPTDFVVHGATITEVARVIPIAIRVTLEATPDGGVMVTLREK